jgi:hypothetical protein
MYNPIEFRLPAAIVAVAEPVWTADDDEMLSEHLKAQQS